MSYSTVLFDLDGTLADTAPDLAAALNKLRLDRNLPPLPLAELRPYASAGARGLIGRGLGINPDHAEYESLKNAFLANYEAALCVHTTLFPGVEALLQNLEQRNIKWGIVTNKIERFTLPLVKQLGFTERAAAIVSGDTTAHAKPNPLPLLYAAEQAKSAPESCIYVGDDLRDIQAGRAAGMYTVAAAYGYCGTEGDTSDTVESWQADVIIQTPLAILDLL